MTHDTPPKRIWADQDNLTWVEEFPGEAMRACEAPYILASEAEAMVAAALREAAELVADDHVSDAILNLADNHAAAALDKLIAEGVEAERERVTRIAASLFPGGYDNNRIKIEDRLSEIAAKGAQT